MSAIAKNEPLPRLRLTRLGDGHCPAITGAIGTTMAEAAAVCLSDHGHSSSKPLEVIGEQPNFYLLSRPRVTDQMSRAYANRKVAVELAAAGVAICLVHERTKYSVFHQSAGDNNGIDYWLSDKLSDDIEVTGRLEVSGSLKGGAKRRKSRTKLKSKQVTRSDDTGLPSIVVVVEFSELVAEVINKP